jgi:hypothetical protein
MGVGRKTSKSVRAIFTLFAVVCLALPAFAKTHVINVLGTYPLFGASQSRTQFIALMNRHPERENAALTALGIDRAAFERGIRSAPSVVTGAQFHLDEMAYYSDGVKVVRDVEIPTHTWMWVVRLPRKTVYIPQLCGNIATVGKAAVAAYESSFPVSALQHAPLGPIAGVAVAPIPLSTLVPIAPAALVPVATHGKFPWWIFLLPAALLHGSTGSTGSIPPPIIAPPVRPSSSPSPTSTPCPSPTPKPPPTPCPSPTKSPAR